MEDKKVKRPVTARRRYWNFNTQLAAASALAAAAFYPFDALKTRIQLGQGSGLQVARNMAISTFYKGFSAGVLRQAALTFFASKSLKTFYVSPLIANERKRLTNNDPFPCLLSAGALGAFLSSPADLILTRMQADAALPASQRRNYLNIFHAIYRIIRDDGVLSLWKGGFPTVIRTTATTAGIYGVSHGFKALLTIFTPDMVSRVPDNASRCKWKISIHWFFRLYEENLQIRRATHILCWISSLLSHLYASDLAYICNSRATSGTRHSDLPESMNQQLLKSDLGLYYERLKVFIFFFGGSTSACVLGRKMVPFY